MIQDEEIDRAVNWLRDTAREGAQKRANRLYLEQWIKTVKAQEAGKFAGTSQAAAENEALRSQAYLDALQGYREAIEADETYRFMREAASAKIEAWRTQSSNARAEGKVG